MKVNGLTYRGYASETKGLQRQTNRGLKILQIAAEHSVMFKNHNCT
jgi:hypothetical protein